MHTSSIDKGLGYGVIVNDLCVKSFCVTCTCWNVGGWYHRNSKLREAVIHILNRDIVAIVESHLRFNLFNNFSVSISNDKVKDSLWLQLTHLTSKDIALFCVCYLPPTTNSGGDHSFEFFNNYTEAENTTITVLRSYCYL